MWEVPDLFLSRARQRLGSRAVRVPRRGTVGEGVEAGRDRDLYTAIPAFDDHLQGLPR